MVNFRKQFILVFSCILLASFFSGKSAAIDTLEIDEIQMLIGELETLEVYDLTRLSLSDPSVADIVEADDKEILLIARSVGRTALFLWDEHGKRTVMVRVFSQDLTLTKERLEKLFILSDFEHLLLEYSDEEGKVVVSGHVKDGDAQRFQEIISPFQEDLINLVKTVEQRKDLIQIDMQVTELSTTLQKTLGIDWTAGGSGITLQYPETLPTFDGSRRDLFKVGDFERTTSLLATVDALLTEGKARVLSQPKIVVNSGNEAELLIGGEVPIRTTTSTSSGSTQENVSFVEFGISMVLTPEIVDEKIDIELNVEVSEIDASVPTTSGDVAFSTRNASTFLTLEDGQTVVIAGLIKQNRSEQIKKVPFLGEIPVVGMLFRKKSMPSADLDQEMVISLTPKILIADEHFSSKQGKKKVDEAKGEDSTEQVDSKAKHTEQYSPFISGIPLGIPREMMGYVQTLQEKLSQSISYPREAQDSGWEGTVKLGLLILDDGTLAFAAVKESSGYDIFDEFALKTARNNAPYSGFPPNTDLQELNITIPIVYSLNRN